MCKIFPSYIYGTPQVMFGLVNNHGKWCQMSWVIFHDWTFLVGMCGEEVGYYVYYSVISYLIVCLFECLSINRIECWIEVRKRNIAVSVKCLILFPRRPVIQDCQLKLTDNQYKVNLILPNFLLNWVACNLLTFQINYFKTFSINFSDPLKWINEFKKWN